MNTISNFFSRIYNYLASIPFDTLALIDLCAFGGIFALTLFACVVSKKIRHANKRAFFHLLNAFAAITLALFSTRYTMTQAIAATAVFWCAGYLLYGLLSAISARPAKTVYAAPKPVPVAIAQPTTKSVVASASAPVAKNVVRLDHALSIADKLLLKTLGRGDRQEIEKIKTALTVLKVKDELTPQDGEALNDMFNALLKLMAKYDL